MKKLHERRTIKKERSSSLEPRKKFAMFLDICSRPRNTASSGFRTPQSSRSVHYAGGDKEAHVAAHSCELKAASEDPKSPTELAAPGGVGLVHSRTTSWPLSHSNGSANAAGEEVDARTVSWVRNTLDVLTAGAFTDFSAQPNSSGDKEKLMQRAGGGNARSDKLLPSITVTSSAFIEASSPDSMTSVDGSNDVFTSPVTTTAAADGQLFLLPPIVYSSPGNTRRYSGDSGYSGTQSVSSNASNRVTAAAAAAKDSEGGSSSTTAAAAPSVTTKNNFLSVSKTVIG